MAKSLQEHLRHHRSSTFSGRESLNRTIENKIMLLSMILFVPLYLIFGKIGINTHQYNHKYLHDIYHLAYGIFVLFLLQKILRFYLTLRYF